MDRMDSSAFAILAAAVAAQLGPDWNARPDSGFQAGARLACEDGRGIALVLHGRSITARGVLPHRPRLTGRPDAPSITMAATTAEYVTSTSAAASWPRTTRHSPPHATALPR